MAQPKCVTAICAVAVFHLIQHTVCYSFWNCIENPLQDNEFNCIQRRQRNVSALVQDLPIQASVLNISHNYIQNIPSRSFSHLHHLMILRVDYNYIETVGANAFLGLGELRTLNLSLNKIGHLNSSAFAGLWNLTQLFLNGNLLKMFSPLIFSDLSNLTDLSLRTNHLDNFSEIVESVAHLTKLMTLDLCNNSLQTLQHSSSLPLSLRVLYLCNNLLYTLGCEQNFLSSVQFLDLSYNKPLHTDALAGINLENITNLKLRFTSIIPCQLFNVSNVRPGCVDFSGMSLSHNHSLVTLCARLKSRNETLHGLVLQNNEIHILQKGTFYKCPLISTMDLSHNKLQRMDCLRFLQGQQFIKKLTVEHNLLKNLLSCHKLNTLLFPNLTTLSYRYNRIRNINSFAFSHMPMLQTLKLNINSIAYLDKNALRGLKNLSLLRLDNNLLTDLYKDTFSELYSLQILNLRNNQISVIFSSTFNALNQLRILDLGGNKISQLQSDAFLGLTTLKNLYLDRNHLKYIDSSQFWHISATLQVLDLQWNLIRYLSKHTKSPFVHLNKLQDLKLDGQQPFGITLLPQGFFGGLHSLKSLYLTSNKISSFQADTFDNLTNLEFLSIENCCVGVTQLQPRIFKNLRKLKRLNAENMGIMRVSDNVFGNLTELRVLQLTRNAIKTVNQSLLEHLPNLRYIDLRLNPLSCTCHNSWLQNWTKLNQKVQLVYLYNITCPDLPRSKFYNFDVKVCYLDLGVYLFASTSTFIFMLTIVPLLYVKLYWNFKYSYYVFRSWFNDHWRRLQDEEEQWKYDAFVSYNSADEQWVLDQLMPNLEGNDTPHRLCLHHRDFEVGRDIVDNIVAAVYGSRKTVCVVSQNYLRSEWCSLEIQMASYRLFHEFRDVLVLVFLEHIPERQLSAYHRMRKVMLNKTYLQWPGPDCSDPAQAQEVFWNQLRRALRNSSTNNQVDEYKEHNEFSVKEQETEDTVYYLRP